MKIMVAYDGTLQAKEALMYGMDKARKTGGEVVALSVFNNGMYVDYDATADAEEMGRRESARFVEEAKALIREKSDGVRVSLFTTDGNPEEEMIGFAKARKADVLLCPPRFKAIIKKYQKALGASELGIEAGKMDVAAFSTRKL